MSTNSHIFIRDLHPKDTQSLLDLRVRNRSFLKSFEPQQTETHFTYADQWESIKKTQQNSKDGLGYSFGIFLAPSDQLIGRVNLSNIVRGAWQNCTIGYFIDQSHQGKGYMTQAVKQAVHIAFTFANLHRVQAAIMPHNIGSIRVVTKVGFRYEGTSLKYLQINGLWEDHQIYAITQEDRK